MHRGRGGYSWYLATRPQEGQYGCITSASSLHGCVLNCLCMGIDGCVGMHVSMYVWVRLCKWVSRYVGVDLCMKGRNEEKKGGLPVPWI
jgi:hypothetical protein